jgi:pyrophosphatase PpaX
VSTRAGSFEACLFDLDGTLIDSIELIFQSYEHTFRAHALPVAGRDVILAHLGRTLAQSFADFVEDPSRVEALVQTYRAFNLTHHDDLVKPYPGARAAVEALKIRGRRVGIVTSKKRDTALRGLALCGFDEPFDVFVGMEDCIRHKPDPEPLTRALEALSIGPKDACYVGDSPHDVASGNAAGVPVFVAGWGPFSREHFASVTMEAWLQAPEELLEHSALQRVRV